MSFHEPKPVKVDVVTSTQGLPTVERVDKHASAMSFPRTEPVERVDQITSTVGLPVARKPTEISVVFS